MTDRIVDQIVAKLYATEPDPFDRAHSWQPIADKAEDLMGSQQAMPDEGALAALRGLVEEAYHLGWQNAMRKGST